MMDFNELIMRFFVLVLALSFHELAHAWVAFRLGDDTAERAGRLSLNPLVHLDPLGTLFILTGMPLGWAKPVPVNPFNLRNPRTSMSLVAFAGPLSNILLGILGCLLFWMYGQYSGSRGTYLFLLFFVQINFALAVFNLLPIHPLDGGKIIGIFLSEKAAHRYETTLERWGLLPILLLVALEWLPGPGPLTLWFGFWRPLLTPFLQLFSVPSYFLW